MSVSQAPEPDRDRHRPLDRDAMRVAAVELASRGLTPRDVAAALSLTEAAVRQLLGTREAA
jgi:hypothetical protein